MKKILFIVPSFPSVSETFIVNQICALIDLGHDVTIYSLGYPSSHPNVVHQKIIDYNLLEKVIFPEFGSIFWRLNEFVKAVKNSNRLSALRSLNPFKFGRQGLRLTVFCKIKPFLDISSVFDVVHIHFGQMLENYLVLKDTGLITCSNVVLTFHGYDLEENHVDINRNRYQRIIQDHIKITVNTPYLLEIFQKTIPDHHGKYILPVGLDTSHFRPISSARDEDQVDVVFCGRFIKLKGIQRLPNIIEQIFNKVSKEVVFHIAGDGDPLLRKEFLKKIKPYIESGHVIYYGSITQERIINLYNKCDIFILPGIYDNGRAETQGLVIQEAQAMQLPVVVTNAGGMKYGLIDGETGFVVGHLSDKQFAEKVIALIQNKSLREKMGRKGRAYVVENYDSAVLARKLINIYNSYGI